MKLPLLRSVLIISYFAVWFGFGLYYYHEAQLSHGQRFIFQQDIAYRAKYESFKKRVGFAVPENLFRLLTSNTEYDFWATIVSKQNEAEDKISGKTYVYNKSIRIENETTEYLYSTLNYIDDPWYFPSDNMIDHTFLTIMPRLSSVTYRHFDSYSPVEMPANWCTYYLYKFDFHGINLFKIGRSDAFQTGKIIPVQVYSYISHSAKSYTGLDGHSDIAASDAKQKGKFLLFLDKKLVTDYNWYIANNNYIDISQMCNLISQSRTFPDWDARILYQVINGSYEYQVWDFLYFSAVTITTLGYGDILPNDTTIRKAVMAETFLGLVLLGCFISTLFIKQSKYP